MAQVPKQEEERFGETPEHGMSSLDVAWSTLPAGEGATLDGANDVTLYDN